MFCDAAGKPVYPGRVVKTFDWSIANDSALPAWLTTNGTSPILAYTGTATSRGQLRCTTKSTTPTSGDIAGVATNFNIDTSQFSEIAFVVYGVLTDGSTSGTDHNLSIQLSDGVGGLFIQNGHADSGIPSIRVYSPVAYRFPFQWDISKTSAQKRKDIGVVIRPRTKEVFVCAGDPAEGAGVVVYDVGNWTNLSNQPFMARVITRSAAQRYIEFQRIKLRLVSD